MSLLLIRHAETALAGTFCGHSDPPVNLRGLEQIETLLSGLRDSGFAAVYTSDLRRAHTTAAALAAVHAVPLVTRPALREIDFGEWEGLQLVADRGARRRSPHSNGWTATQTCRRREARPSRLLRLVCWRRVAALQQLAGSSLVAVVTHAGVLRVVLQTLCHIDHTLAHTITKALLLLLPLPAGAGRMIEVRELAGWPLDPFPHRPAGMAQRGVLHDRGSEAQSRQIVPHHALNIRFIRSSIRRDIRVTVEAGVPT